MGGRRPVVGIVRMVAALVRQRRRLALASVAIALSVGYLAGALSLLDRVSAGLDNLAAAGAENADLVVEGEVAYQSALEQTRRLVPAGLVEPISQVPGVAAVSARFEEITMVLRPDGEPIVAPGLSEQPIGTNWPDDPEMVPYRFVGEGRAPTGPDEVVLDERSAADAGYEVGDTVPIVGRGEPARFTVVGIVATDEGALPDGSSLALFQTDTARELFAAGDNANRIAIRLDDGADVAAVEAEISSILPFGSELVDAATAAEHRQESLTRSFTLIRVLILGFAGLALVVGMATVANSLTLLYSERRRTFAALRLVGARPRQLLTAALIEAGMLATVSALIGVPLGILLGLVIEQGLGALGTAVPVAGPLVSPSALVWAVLIGVAATLLSAIVPAWRAGRVPPIEAVAEVRPQSEETAGRRALNVVIASVGVAAAVVGLMALADVPLAVALAVGAGVVVAAAIVVTAPALLAAVVGLGIALLPLSSPAIRRIGARDALRNRSRTAATTAALLIATGVVAAIAVFLASFASSVDSDVNDLVRGDLVVDSRTFTKGGLPAELVAGIGELDDVGSVTGWQLGRVDIGGRMLRLTGVDGAALDATLDPDWTEGSSHTLTPSGIALSAETAEEAGVGLGDVVPVEFHSGGVENLVVEGIYRRGAVLLGGAMIDRSVLMAQIPASYDLFAVVDLGDETDTAAGREAVEALALEYGVTAVLDPADFVDSRSDLLTGFERVIQWMLLFTLIQALIGVVNTLLMSVGERRREFGLLRVAGASPRQLRRMVLGEGVSFAVVGTVLGLVAGVVVAVAAVRALAGFGISGVTFPVGVLAVTAVAAVALGVLAAVLPASLAATVPPLEAVADSGAAVGLRGRLRPERLTGLLARRGTREERTPVPPTWVPAPAPSSPEPESESPVTAPSGAGAAVPPPYRGPMPAQPAAVPSSDGPALPQEPSVEPVAPAAPAPPHVPPSEPITEPITVSPSPAAGWLRDVPIGGERATDTAQGSPRPTFEAAGAAATPRSPFDASRRPGRGLDPAAALRLRDVIGSLDPAAVETAGYALSSFARVLEPDEQVEHLVQGWTRGSLCVVGRTDRRVVVVIDRFPEAIIESLDPMTTHISVFGPPGSERVSVSVLDGRRLLEVTGVADRIQAAAMVSAPGHERRRRRAEYF